MILAFWGFFEVAWRGSGPSYLTTSEMGKIVVFQSRNLNLGSNDVGDGISCYGGLLWARETVIDRPVMLVDIGTLENANLSLSKSMKNLEKFKKSLWGTPKIDSQDLTNAGTQFVYAPRKFYSLSG